MWYGMAGTPRRKSTFTLSEKASGSKAQGFRDEPITCHPEFGLQHPAVCPRAK